MNTSNSLNFLAKIASGDDSGLLRLIGQEDRHENVGILSFGETNSAFIDVTLGNDVLLVGGKSDPSSPYIYGGTMSVLGNSPSSDTHFFGGSPVTTIGNTYFPEYGYISVVSPPEHVSLLPGGALITHTTNTVSTSQGVFFVHDLASHSTGGRLTTAGPSAIKGLPEPTKIIADGDLYGLENNGTIVLYRNELPSSGNIPRTDLSDK